MTILTSWVSGVLEDSEELDEGLSSEEEDSLKELSDEDSEESVSPFGVLEVGLPESVTSDDSSSGTVLETLDWLGLHEQRPKSRRAIGRNGFFVWVFLSLGYISEAITIYLCKHPRRYRCGHVSSQGWRH